MYSKCYYFKDKMYVKDVIQFISNYQEYDIYVYDRTGIIINDTSDRIAIEGYYFNSDMFSFVSKKDYYEYLNNSKIFYRIRVKDFIDIIKDYSNTYITIADEKECLMYVGDGKVNFDFLQNEVSYDLLKQMKETKNAEFITIS